MPWVEPGLPRALERLTENQRVAVMLVHGLDWTLTETAKFLSISPGSVNKHAERGLAKLRAAMEVQADV
jgi:DNA-directed RNA polymerase specialized sigma24 family protein